MITILAEQGRDADASMYKLYIELLCKYKLVDVWCFSEICPGKVPWTQCLTYVRCTVLQMQRLFCWREPAT